MMVIRLLITVLIVVGAGMRLSMLAAQSRFQPPTAGIDRDDLARQLESLADDPAGDTVAAFCFSADAQVILTVGDDGQPGIAGEDDNANQILDDRREMGAVGSDDECLAPSDAGYDAMRSRDDTLVISTGAFVRCDDAANAERYLSRDWGWFVR